MLCTLCVACGGDFGRSHCVGGETRAVMCGTPRAAAMLASEVARRAICPRDAGRPAGLGRPLWPVGVSCRVLLTLK